MLISFHLKLSLLESSIKLINMYVCNKITTMIKDLWLNLPVKDLKQSKAFYAAIGFSFNTNYGDTNTSACLMIADKFVVMLFENGVFEGFTQHPVSNTMVGSEVLISIDAENREEVDEMAQKVITAGGTVFGEPNENQGWMYGMGFSDLDGHRWNMVYMDWSKMPK
jgi:uncharacterized protein